MCVEYVWRAHRKSSVCHCLFSCELTKRFAVSPPSPRARVLRLLLGAHNTTAHAWRRSKRCVTTCARVTATMRKSTTWSRRFAATRPTSRLDRTNPSTLRLHASYLRLNSGPWEAGPDRTMGATGRMATAATVADSVADSVIAATRGPLLRIRWRRSQKWPCTLAAAIVACLRSR